MSPYDASFATPDPYPESDYDRGDDAILDGFTRAYGGAFSSYARNELGFKTEMTYTLLDGDISRQWEWGSGRGGGRAAGKRNRRHPAACSRPIRPFT